MRGEKEKNSLDRVKSYLFCHKEKQQMMIACPYNYTISDDDVLDNIKYYINARRDCYFGMVFEDIQDVIVALLTAREDKDNNKFPDFICDNGFIEHFQVTSSVEKGKGSARAKFEAGLNRKIKPELAQFEENCLKKASPGYTDSISWVEDDVAHSYENLQKSMKKNMDKHLKSANDYEGSNKLKIFLIEYVDSGLEMIEIFDDVDFENGASPKHYFHYKLSVDKNMLNQLYQLKDKIDYIIILINEKVEIVKISQIPSIIKNIKYDLAISGRVNKVIRKTIYKCVAFKNIGEINE